MKLFAIKEDNFVFVAVSVQIVLIFWKKFDDLINRSIYITAPSD